jgi:dinuclear metal center YbgI/SA1388 family protein
MLKSAILIFILTNCIKTATATANDSICLKQIVELLEEYAPLNTATDWDNVGLLVEPSDPLYVNRALITNDLTEAVLSEALAKKVNLIISYHPAIHPHIDKPLRRLTQSDWKQRSIVKCIENKIAVYSPHTTWDSIDGGINDWILEQFDAILVKSVRATKALATPSGYTKVLQVNVYEGRSERKRFVDLLKEIQNVNFLGEEENELNSSMTNFEFLTDENGVLSLMDLLRTIYGQDVVSTVRIYDQDRPLIKNVGLGRIGTLKAPLKISDIVTKLKSFLNMKSMRIALANGKSMNDTVSVLAIGAGSSTGLLNDVEADLIITGEITHHEILHETHRGVSLIVTDHSYTERPFINRFIDQFGKLLKKHNAPQIELIKSGADRDPLQYI